MILLLRRFSDRNPDKFLRRTRRARRPLAPGQKDETPVRTKGAFSGRGLTYNCLGSYRLIPLMNYFLLRKKDFVRKIRKILPYLPILEQELFRLYKSSGIWVASTMSQFLKISSNSPTKVYKRTLFRGHLILKSGIWSHMSRDAMICDN